MKKHIFCFAFLMLMVMVLSGCSEDVSSSSDETVEINDSETVSQEIPDELISMRIGTSAAETGSITQAANWFAEEMNKRTGGKVTIKVYPSDTISGGAQAKGIEMLIDGSADLTFHSNLIYSTLDQRLNVISLPWLFDDYNDVDTTLSGEAGDAIAEILSEYGIKVLGFAQNGFRQITNNVREIKSVEDLADLQIRVNNSQMQINLFKAMGADPLNLNFPEVYTALQQGSIDGQETPVDVTFSSNIHEVSEFLSVWNYMYDSFILGINNEKFESFSPELQKIIIDTAEEACEYERQLIRDLEIEQLEKIEASGTVVTYADEMDIEGFKNTSEVIYEEYESIVTPELLELFRD